MAGRVDGYLMVARFGVQTNPKQVTGAIAEVVECLVASGYGKLIRFSDRVEATIGNAHAPYEEQYVDDIFLMGFGSEDDLGGPSASVV